jgi:RNA polymerase sigma-70 factor (ECF subfamily)
MRQRKQEDARRQAPSAEMSDDVEQDPLRQIPDATPSPERLTQSVELRRQMENALQSLTPAERIAFLMRHCDGCGIEEIAAALKSNSSAAKNTVFRAVHKLRQTLQPQFAPRATARAMGTES